MRNVDPVLTLRAAALLVLAGDADDVVLAHGRQRTGDVQFTNLINVLDADMNDLKQMGVTRVKFFLEFNHEARARAATFYWPCTRLG